MGAIVLRPGFLARMDASSDRSRKQAPKITKGYGTQFWPLTRLLYDLQRAGMCAWDEPLHFLPRGRETRSWKPFSEGASTVTFVLRLCWKWLRVAYSCSKSASSQSTISFILRAGLQGNTRRHHLLVQL